MIPAHQCDSCSKQADECFCDMHLNAMYKERYDAGYDKGREHGYDDGFTQGKFANNSHD